LMAAIVVVLGKFWQDRIGKRYVDGRVIDHQLA